MKALNSPKSLYFSSLILPFFLLVGCRDDLDFHHQSSGNSISFDIGFMSAWQDGDSRSSDVQDEILDMKVIKGESETYNSPLYLHCLTTNIPNSNNSRQEQISRGSFAENIYSDFGVYAFAYNETTKENLDLNNPNYIVNDQVTNVNGNWVCGRYWPNEECTLDFYAYSPFLPNNEVLCFPEFKYTVSSDFKEQKDLLVSEKTTISYNPTKDQIPVHLDFKHALTSVRFELNLGTIENPKKFEPGIITKIRLVNIPCVGAYNFCTQEWRLTGETNDFPTYEIEYNTDKKDSEDTYIISSDESFFMIPQEFDEDSDAKVEIEFTDNFTSTPQKLSFSLAGHTWKKGQRVIYKLSTDPNMIEQVFRIVLLPEGTVYYPGNDEVYGQNFVDLFKCSYAGTSKQIRVESYAKTYNSKTNNIQYTPFPVSFNIYDIKEDNSLDFNESKYCKIMKDETIEGHCEDKGFYGYTIEIDHLNGIVDNSIEPHNAWLKQQSAVGIKNAYNLSNPNNPESRVVNVYDATIEDADVGYNTANCYLVNAPGKYCFPLIYGNSVKQGRQNGRAFYNATENLRHDEYKVLMHFPNHNGALIEYPYIDHYLKENSNVTAEVIWMDKSNLIINPKIIKYFDKKAKRDYRFVEFEVPQNSIEQGNAVIAVKENGVIVWSWHIWVTDFKLREEERTVDDYDFAVSTNLSLYKFMPRNIGWVYCKHMDYYPKEYKVCINRKNLDTSSDRGNINHFFKISQSGGSIYSEGYNVVYQWGRSTPFPGGRWDYEKSSIVDCIDSEYSIKFQELPLLNTVINGNAEDCVSYSIRNPDKFFYSDWLSCWMQTADDHNGTMILNLWSTYMDYHGWNYIQIYEKQYKSIFDPSPVGYMLPQANSFVPFDYDHMIMEEEKNGMSYYSTENPINPGKSHLFFPFSGYRRGSDGKWKMGKVGKENFGQYYTTILYNTQMAYHLCIHSGGEIYNPHHQGSRLIDGMSVRPIRE